MPAEIERQLPFGHLHICAHFFVIVSVSVTLVPRFSCNMPMLFCFMWLQIANCLLYSKHIIFCEHGI